MSKPILVTAALGIELRALARLLGRVIPIRHSAFSARRCRLKGQEIVMLRTGVGRSGVSSTVETALEAFEPKAVLAIGLAGGLRIEFRTGDPFEVSSASIWSGDSESLSIEQAVGLSEVYHSSGSPILAETDKGSRVRRARTLTVDKFVSLTKEKRRLGTAGFDLVDMEFGEIAKLVDNKGLPLTGLMTVSDTLVQDFPDVTITSAGKLRRKLPPRLMSLQARSAKLLGAFAFASLMKMINADGRA